MHIVKAPAKKNRKRRERVAVIQKAVLFALKATGGITMAMVAPNALSVLEQFGWVPKRRSSKDTINKSVIRLTRSGLVTTDETGLVELTSKGERRLAEFERAHFQLAKPEKWDGKWRVVSFDIKEKRKRVRELLRMTLSAVGFVHLHHSVWVYPHNCEDFLSLLKADYHVGVEILYIIADYIENDHWLRAHFRIGEFAGT